jgi:hypothetical protein
MPKQHALDLLDDTRPCRVLTRAWKRHNWLGRAMNLFFRLNADMLNYTPLSHRAQRAARIMPRLVAAMEKRS